MKPMTAVAALGLALGMMAAGTAQAQITIPTVTVGDAGNPNDSTGYGAVSYVYNIGTYEVTLSQYTAFLNAVAATDTYNLYNPNMGTDLHIAGIMRSGSSGSYTYAVTGPSGTNPPGANSPGNRPVTYVSWFDAARFANWLANGQPTGAQGNATTEDGAYSLFGATSGVGFTKNSINPNTGSAPTWWIPSEDEWYKAAYYDPTKGGSGYWLYPTQSDSTPGNVIGAGANQANYYNGSVFSVTQTPIWDANQNYLADGGAFSSSGSYYGTFDQGGNAWEWNDAVLYGNRGLRGGSWYYTLFNLHSFYRDLGWEPHHEDSYTGFRVASVPEPSTAMLILLGGGAYWLMRRRKATL